MKPTNSYLTHQRLALNVVRSKIFVAVDLKKMQRNFVKFFQAESILTQSVIRSALMLEQAAMCMACQIQSRMELNQRGRFLSAEKLPKNQKIGFPVVKLSMHSLRKNRKNLVVLHLSYLCVLLKRQTLGNNSLT